MWSHCAVIAVNTVLSAVISLCWCSYNIVINVPFVCCLDHVHLLFSVYLFSFLSLFGQVYATKTLGKTW